MMEDRFLENDPAPLFLAGPIDEAEQSGLSKVVSSEAFKKGVLIFGAAATVFAVVWVVKAILFAGGTTSEATRSAPRYGGSPSAPVMQSTASASNTSTSTISVSNDSTSSSSAQALPAAPAGATPAGDQLLAAFKAAVENKAVVENKAEADQPADETLFNQFKAWATEENAQVPARQAVPPQIAPVETVQDARAEAVQTARSEVVPLPKRRPTNFDTVRAHEPTLQAPSLLRQLGWRNY